MKYFKITLNTDIDLIEKYPQVKDLKIDFHEARASQWSKIDKWNSENDIPDLENFKLNAKAKLTDLLTNSFVDISSGLIMSERCKQVLEIYRINGSFYPAIIYEEEVQNKYYFLWYEYGAKSKIDWQKSSFIEYYELAGQEKFGEPVSIDNFADYKIKWGNLIRKNGNDTHWDIFPKILFFSEAYDFTPAFGLGLICNEKIKQAVEDNHMSGFLFKTLDIELKFG